MGSMYYSETRQQELVIAASPASKPPSKIACSNAAGLRNPAVQKASGGTQEMWEKASLLSSRVRTACPARRTLDFGGAAFGLHANLMTFSYEDIAFCDPDP